MTPVDTAGLLDPVPPPPPPHATSTAPLQASNPARAIRFNIVIGVDRSRFREAETVCPACRKSFLIVSMMRASFV